MDTFDTDWLTPAVELEFRIAALQARLQQASIDAALLLQNSDRFYFAGTIQQAHLWVPAEGPALLMVRKDFARARTESTLERVTSIDRAADVPMQLEGQGYAPAARLGMELDVLPVQLWRRYRQLFPGAEIVDVSPDVRRVRAVKSPWEIDRMRAAAERADRVTAYVPEVLTAGVSEIELAGRIEAFARKLGHQGIVRMRLWGSEMFYGHLMSGGAAAVPSFLASPTGGVGVGPAVAQGAGLRRLRPNEPILFDYVFAYRGYLADQTRIFCLGEPGDEIAAAHEAMLAVERAVMEAARPGVAAGALYDLALETAARYGYAQGFMGADERPVRFVGHGLGIELDEFPFLARGQKMPLAKNMTVALEPKVILPDIGVAGIENTHRVTDRGLEPFTRLDGRIVVV